jgi:hypothetical protein
MTEQYLYDTTAAQQQLQVARFFLRPITAYEPLACLCRVSLLGMKRQQDQGGERALQQHKHPFGGDAVAN